MRLSEVVDSRNRLHAEHELVAASHQPGTSSGERRLSRSHSIKVPSGHAAAAHDTTIKSISKHAIRALSPSLILSATLPVHTRHRPASYAPRLLHPPLSAPSSHLEPLSAPRVRRWHSLAAAPGEPLATARLPREGTGFGQLDSQSTGQVQGTAAGLV